MARTSSDAVKALMRYSVTGTDYDGSTDLAPFIATASAHVDDISAYATRNELEITATRLELIERWLTAWAYCMSDRTYASRSTGGKSGSFHGRTDMGFNANFYGQTAVSLDTTGFLAAQGKGQRGSLVWAGKRHSERINHDQRN